MLFGLGLSALVKDSPGTIQVNCNIPEARVILDATATDYFTDAIISGIHPGRHLLTLEKTGFKIAGDAIQEVTVKSGDTVVMSFYLTPAVEESARPDGHSAGDEPMGRR